MLTLSPIAEPDPEPDIEGHSGQLNHSNLNNSINNDSDAGPNSPASVNQAPSSADVDLEAARQSEDGDTPWSEPTWAESVKNTIRAVPVLAALPVLLPVAWALHFSHQSPIATFVTSLLAIVPLAGGLGFATEELATRIGDAWGGLLNATFGNAVELLVAILALVKGDLDIVQASMAGSILSNILLVLGMSYFAGGLRFHEQLYAVVGAQTHISLLGISITAVLLPAAFHLAFPATTASATDTVQVGEELPAEELSDILAMSRGLSIILLVVYGMFLTFQLWTHAYLFTVPRDPPTHPLPGPAPTHARVFPKPHWVPSLHSVPSRDTVLSAAPASHPSARIEEDGHPVSPSRDTDEWRDRDKRTDDTVGSTRAVPNIIRTHSHSHTHAHAHPRPRVRSRFALAALAVFTGLAGLTAECLVASIDGLTESTPVSREFVGLVLLPVIGNAVEHITAVTVSLKDRLNLSLSIAVGSSVQVSLCLLPLLVLLGWAIGRPMTLLFDAFETIALVVAVVLVNFAISDGRTNYLEGFVLMMAYVSIALVCWYYDPTH